MQAPEQCLTRGAPRLTDMFSYRFLCRHLRVVFALRSNPEMYVSREHFVAFRLFP